jgi:hypothetical protein
MEMMLWNAALSLLTGLILFWIKQTADEQKRIQILLNKTREEMARDYMTRTDVHNDINRVLDRLDRLDNKIDALIKEQRSALG